MSLDFKRHHRGTGEATRRRQANGLAEKQAVHLHRSRAARGEADLGEFFGSRIHSALVVDLASLLDTRRSLRPLSVAISFPLLYPVQLSHWLASSTNGAARRLNQESKRRNRTDRHFCSPTFEGL